MKALVYLVCSQRLLEVSIHPKKVCFTAVLVPGAAEVDFVCVSQLVPEGHCSQTYRRAG